MTLVLIGCCGKKATEPGRPKSLYLSPLFQKAIAWAEAREYPWRVLSAHYGLARPEETLAPYEATLASMPVADRAEWGEVIAAELADVLNPGDVVIALAGWTYIKPWQDIATERLGLAIDEPLRGMGIGRRLQWLSREAANA